MTRRTPTHRRLLAPLTATIVVVLSVVVPTLDSGWAGPAPVFESEHDTAHCVVGHDHTICTQAGASRALPSGPTGNPPPEVAEWSVRVACADTPPPRDPTGGRHSRAPPLARV